MENGSFVVSFRKDAFFLILMNSLLQVKFLVVEFLNLTYLFFPNPIRRVYLRLFLLKVGRHSYIHRSCKFFHVGKFSVGRNSVINFGCYLDNRRGLYIGNNVGIAHDTKIYTLGHDINDSLFRAKGSPVYIEDNVFVFSNVLIMPGITIHEGAVVLSGAVVTKEVPAYTVVGGNPAKYIKERNRNIDYLNNYGYWFAL